MKKKRKIKKILFVCTGNTCRSVMAKGLLRKMLKDKKINDIEVQSCGISAADGFSPTDKTIKVMKNIGIDVSGHKTARLTKKMIEESDLILTMQNVHKDEVLNLAAEAADKTYLLKELAKRKPEVSNFAMSDPIGRPLEVYERVLAMIKEAVKELVKKL